MKIARETLEMDWAGPLEGDLPTAILFGAVVTIMHGTRMIPWESVRGRLKNALGGAPREKRMWRAVEMTWEAGKVPVKVRLDKKRIRINVLRRVTPTKFKRLLEAFVGLPSVGAVHLTAQVIRSADAAPANSGQRDGSRRPAWMNTFERFGHHE